MTAPTLTELESRCLEAFPTWLRTLGDDARALAALVEAIDTPAPVRRKAAAALNYLLRSLDLIPDGIEDLGFIDDAFVFRVAASGAGADTSDPSLSRLAGDAGLIRELLEGDYARLDAYVAGLGTAPSRGRTVDDILGDAAVTAEFVRDIRGWADAYTSPAFQRDAKNLVKLKSFLAAKLPK